MDKSDQSIQAVEERVHRQTTASGRPKRGCRRQQNENEEEQSVPRAQENSNEFIVRRRTRKRRNEADGRKKWKKEELVTLMKCYYRSEPCVFGYRKRLFKLWCENSSLFDATEQRLADQARAILKYKWLTEIELEEIKRDEQKRKEVQISCESIDNEEEKRRDNLEDDRVDIAEELRGNGREESSSPYEVNETESQRTDPFDVNNQSTDRTLSENEEEIRSRIIKIMRENRTFKLPPLRHVNVNHLKEITKQVNMVVSTIDTDNITDTNTLLLGAAQVITEMTGTKINMDDGLNPRRKKPQAPFWKRRIEKAIVDLRRDISRLEEIKRGRQLQARIVYKLEQKYKYMKKKSVNVVQEELKQRVRSKANAIRRYDKRCKRFRDNNLFQVNQKKFYANLKETNHTDKQDDPDKQACVDFWRGIWSKSVQHNREAEWLRRVKEELEDVTIQPMIEITNEKVKAKLSRIANWKTPGPDGVQGYWLKNMKCLHGRISHQLNSCVSCKTEVPKWMTTGRTYLIQKDPKKGSAASNYRPITCLPIMWKLLTGIIADEMYQHLESESLLCDEQKGCKKGSRGCKEQLLIDKMVLRNCKRRKTNLFMAFIDYRKAYDMVPHSWIIESLKLYGIATNIIQFILRAMEQSQTELTHQQTSFGNVNIKRGIFQGDSLSPLLFIIAMMPLTVMLRTLKNGYEIEKNLKINHRLYMDDIKLYAKSKRELDSLIQSTRIFSEDIKMEFGVDKCAVIQLQRGKKKDFEGIELPDKRGFKDLDDEGYKYLGILEGDEIMSEEMKEKIMKEYEWRVRKILRTALDGRRCMQAINTWAIPVIRYGAGIIKWTKQELKGVDRRTRKMLTAAGVHHPQADVDRLYCDRHEGGRGLMSVEECVEREENAMTTYVARSEDEGLSRFKKSLFKEEVLIGETIDRKEDKKNREERRRTEWKEKEMHGQYVRDLEDVIPNSAKLSWRWLVSQDLKRETEGLIIAAQDQALRTNYIKQRIDKQDVSAMCRMCAENIETVHHIISSCPKLAQSEYKKRHDKVAAIVHWNLCKTNKIECVDKWYQHHADKVVETKEVKILWDFNIQTDKVIEHRRPDIVVFKKKENTAVIIDIAVPGDVKVKDRELEKIHAYQELRMEMQSVYKLRKVKVVPVVIGALGGMTANLERYLNEIDCQIRVDCIQKTALLGTAHILRKVLNIGL